MSTPDNQPTIRSISGIRDGYGRTYPPMVPKAELDAANATADQLAADCDSLTEDRDYWKHRAEELQVDLDAARILEQTTDPNPVTVGAVVALVYMLTQFGFTDIREIGRAAQELAQLLAAEVSDD
ncbi:hypothetical protein QSJ19_01115 [Gordonia sp. ABSL11-1]|uniref:hypothetical protein n=1 Tax=Gordonia sp. ABSL11-1 TaxID=3053924 RepID=UPI0025740A14|nr:hypothetical protein [Gordonia sp. ABSL11-1]MDL9944202.1 hypothetical protein [Gordonia sp. ABSL11-1]